MSFWIKIAGAVLLLALLLWAVIGLSRGLLGLLGQTGDGADEPDPMFAEPMVQITRPPELWDEEGFRQDEREDPSEAWNQESLIPVDKTAEELSQEETN